MIPIPLGNDHTATASVDVWRDVHCEHCHCDFVYRLTVSARGQAMSPLFLAEASAKQKAAERARQGLETKITGAWRLAPCPRCGKYQRQALRAERFRLINQKLGIAVIAGVIASATLFAITGSAFLASTCAVVIVCIPLGIILRITGRLDASASVRNHETQAGTVRIRREFSGRSTTRQ